MKGCDFTFRHYEEMLREAKDRGYTFVRHRDHWKTKNLDKVIFMRHDVDLNMRNAFIIGKREKKNEVVSTFFLRLHRYNLFDPMNYAITQKLREMNHEIGLHWCPDFAVVYGKCDPFRFFEREKRCFKAVVGITYNSGTKGQY